MTSPPLPSNPHVFHPSSASTVKDAAGAPSSPLTPPPALSLHSSLCAAETIDQSRVQNLLGVIFSSITFVAVFQLTAIQPIVAFERSVRIT